MRHRSILIGIVLAAILSQACAANDLHRLKVNLDRAAVTLNAAAKTNHGFYESGVYGSVGSDEAIKMRQKVATVIHDANEKLIKALELAKNLKPGSGTFEGDKLQIILHLSEAAQQLHTGNPKIDLVLQAVALLINQAVVIIETLKSADLKYALPEIQNWQIARIYERA